MKHVTALKISIKVFSQPLPYSDLYMTIDMGARAVKNYSTLSLMHELIKLFK